MKEKYNKNSVLEKSKKPAKGRPPIRLFDYYDLTAENEREIEQLLLRGMSPYAIAGVIKDEWKKCAEVTKDTVIKKVISFRNSLRKKVVATSMVLTTSEGRKSLAQQIESEVDSMAEYHRLILVQKRRLDALLEKESKLASGLLLSNVNANIRMLVDMLTGYVELQQSLGFAPKVPERLLVDASSITNDDKRAFVENLIRHRKFSEATTEFIEAMKGVTINQEGVLLEPKPH